jgi:hypothetical protein
MHTSSFGLFLGPCIFICLPIFAYPGSQLVLPLDYDTNTHWRLLEFSISLFATVNT